MSTILGIDPSGNFKEGKGTTGFCLMEDGKVIDLIEIKASNYICAEDYWADILDVIDVERPDFIVYESYQLYHHKGMKAETQANSFLETPQLIGAIRMRAWEMDIKTHSQSAAEAKTRWPDRVLQAKGYLDKDNKWSGKKTNAHKRDAMRHAIHFSRYKLKEETK